jgi:XTP/dITP diphosphohydrolase
MRLVLATDNPGKQRELAALLEPHGCELVRQGELGIQSAEETGETFEANALLKARHAARLSGLAALADDSGLEVDALEGRPGVRSARYAGSAASDADNLALLLEELSGVPIALRTARFRCVIVRVLTADDPQPLIASGTWDGYIALAPRGASGFGYDPVFIPGNPGAGEGRTAAELGAAEKNASSHRAIALKALLARWA